MVPADPPSILPEKPASDDALDHPRQCSVLIIPVAQKMAKAVMKQADPPGRVRFVTLFWTLCQILIIVGHPPNWNPVFRLLTLVFVQVENRHCTKGGHLIYFQVISDVFKHI